MNKIDNECINKYTITVEVQFVFLERIKENYTPGTPIFAEDILLLFKEFTKAYVYRLLKQAEHDGELIKFSRGVYCLPKESIFGKLSITSAVVATNKYVSNGESVYGIYSGLALLNQFLITNQVPNVLEIVTNNEATRKRIVDIGGMKFIIRKSRFEITKENYSYYTILQLFLDLGINPKLDDFSKQRIIDYMNDKSINQNTLMKIAMSFPAQALKNLIGSEVLNGII